MVEIKEFVKIWKASLKEEVKNYDLIRFDIFQVGNNEASNRYVRNKIKDCEDIGIKVILHKLPEAITTESLCNNIKLANELSSNAIMVQLPVPKTIDMQEVIKRIPVLKDVDGFREDTSFEPCTPKGIIKYLEYNDFEFEGKFAVVLGRSEIVGKPIAKMLLDRNCTVAQCHSHTPEAVRNHLLSQADLVICAVGKQGFIQSKDAPKAFIVDVGINFNEEGKLCGDVIINPGDETRVTPVPGGVGLLTRTALLDNILEAAKKQKY